MNTISDLLIYLDEILTRNLASMFLTGYIDIRTSRRIVDRTLTGRINSEAKRQDFFEDRAIEDQREGFRGSNITTADTHQNCCENCASLEDRGFERCEEEIKKIYTTFMLHGDIIDGLTSSNILNRIQGQNIMGSMKEGDYVELDGKMTTYSIVSYLDILLDVINCYGCDNLNNLLGKSNLGIMNFKTMGNLLQHLKDILITNNTQDLIMKSGDVNAILTVNNNYFLNNTAYIFDKVNCNCKIIGKVIKVCNNNECVSMLRKTTQQDYYEKLLDSCLPLCKVLEENGIVIPKRPNLKFQGKTIVVIPISICI